VAKGGPIAAICCTAAAIAAALLNLVNLTEGKPAKMAISDISLSRFRFFLSLSNFFSNDKPPSFLTSLNFTFFSSLFGDESSPV
jgi:hypothetical protein